MTYPKRQRVRSRRSLTIDEVREIDQRWRKCGPVTLADLSQEYGVSKSHVHDSVMRFRRLMPDSDKN